MGKKPQFLFILTLLSALAGYILWSFLAGQRRGEHETSRFSDSENPSREEKKSSDLKAKHITQVMGENGFRTLAGMAEKRRGESLDDGALTFSQRKEELLKKRRRPAGQGSFSYREDLGIKEKREKEEHVWEVGVKAFRKTEERDFYQNYDVLGESETFIFVRGAENLPGGHLVIRSQRTGLLMPVTGGFYLVFQSEVAYFQFLKRSPTGLKILNSRQNLLYVYVKPENELGVEEFKKWEAELSKTPGLRHLDWEVLSRPTISN